MSYFFVFRVVLWVAVVVVFLLSWSRYDQRAEALGKKGMIQTDNM